jgi:hypothetical protein
MRIPNELTGNDFKSREELDTMEAGKIQKIDGIP